MNLLKRKICTENLILISLKNTFTMSVKPVYINCLKRFFLQNGEEYFDERLLFKHAPKPDFNLVLGRKLLEESDKAEAKKTKQVPLQRNVVSSKSDVNLNAGPSVPIFTDLKAFPPLQNK